MMFTLIVLISIFQVCLYLASEKTGFRYGKAITLLVVLTGYFFVFPRFFYPEPKPNGMNCGLPLVAVTLAFWVFGGGAAIFVHTLYRYWSKK